MSKESKPKMPLRGIRYLMLWVPFWALILHVIGMSLTIPSGYGVEDYLGWAHRGAVDGMNAVWRSYDVGALTLFHGAIVYLALDTAVFIPFYGALFLALADKFLCATARDATAQDEQSQQWLRPVLIGVVAVGGLADLIENLLGMGRLGIRGFVLSLFATAVLVLPMVRALHWAWFKGLKDRYRDRRTALVVVTGLVVGFAGAAWWIGREGGLKGADALLAIGALAHCVKKLALLIYAILLAGLVGAWYFGFCIPPSGKQPLHDERARLRWAVGDMLLRCRYVWIALAVFAGLALVLNQGRDVLYSVAAMETGQTQGFGGLGGLLGSFFVFAVSAVGMWSFGFAAWLWSRSVCLMRSPQSKRMRSDPVGHADRFARDLARLLGLLPPTLFVLLCGSTMHDALMAHEGGVALRLLVFIVVAVAGGAIFVFVHTRDVGEQHFYDCDTFSEWDDHANKQNEGRQKRFRMFGLITPFWLPLYAAGAMFGCRLVAVGAETWPPMVLATFLFTLTFWLSLFGWLSLNEERIATPWVMLLVAVVGALGFTDLMHNHRVGGVVGQAAPASDLGPTVVAALLASICLALFYYIVKRVESDKMSFWGGVGGVGAAILAALAVMVGGQCFVVEKAPLATSPERLTLDAALASWLQELYAKRKVLTEHAGGPMLPVYFINAEGGGIRNAYWTALVLERLAAEVPDFRTRSFSYSGVSGGSVGLAVDRACEGQSESVGRPCLDNLGYADLITPLISTWLFEDALAQILPTSFCRAPACGVLSRGLRFENAMLQAIPQLAGGIAASQPTAGQPHRPYLFLNSTWVESGERAIASKIEIDWQEFPAARDQLKLLQRDLSLATAAHNSARFPFINAIGALEVPAGNCWSGPSDQKSTGGAGKAEICGHLADGGYFDNSGGHTTANILAGLARCLSDTSGDKSECAKQPDVQSWARSTLAPQVIQIRNGVRPFEDQRDSCDKPKPPRTAAEVGLVLEDRQRDRYQPGRPGCDGQMNLYGELLGPLVTAINTTGIGSNGKLAEADLQQKLITLFGQRKDGAPPVANIDLREDGQILYPLGWHLSPSARKGMQTQVKDKQLLLRVAGRGPSWP